MSDATRYGAPLGSDAGAWDLDAWPWDVGRVRLLPVLHGRLEFARAVRAHLDATSPTSVVVEIPREVEDEWLAAVHALPTIGALAIEIGASARYLLVEPCDPSVEAARWALERGGAVVAGDLLVPEYRRHDEPHPDPAALPEAGYGAYVRACLDTARYPRDEHDERRELAVAEAASSAEGERVVVVLGLAHVAGVAQALREGAARPLARPVRPRTSFHPLDADSLVEVLVEPPFVQAAWERARSGELPCVLDPSEDDAPSGEVLSFPGSGRVESSDGAGTHEEDAETVRELEALRRGDDPVARARLVYRLVQQAEHRARSTSGTEPTMAERRVLHRWARNLALVRGRLCADLYELVVAARGAVDDSFARDVLRTAAHWPWAERQRGGLRLRAEDLGLDSRLVTLRPRIDRLSRRPSLAAALRRFREEWEPSEMGICSHVPEDLVVEALGEDLRRLGGARASRAGVQTHPFTTSLLDGVDARETLRRYVVDGRPWVREEIAVRAKVGAVVMIFDPDDDDDGAERFPWRQVWHGEHQNESDMAFYATDPGPGMVAPGIHRAEYGGLLMIWPPWRMGDVWHDPAYRFTTSKAERLLVGALDYSTSPLVVYVSRERPRRQIYAVARRLGRRIVHIPPGVLSRDKMRRVRTFHVLADKSLRSIAEAVIDPPS